MRSCNSQRCYVTMNVGSFFVPVVVELYRDKEITKKKIIFSCEATQRFGMFTSAWDRPTFLPIHNQLFFHHNPRQHIKVAAMRECGNNNTAMK